MRGFKKVLYTRLVRGVECIYLPLNQRCVVIDARFTRIGVCKIKMLEGHCKGHTARTLIRNLKLETVAHL